MLAHARRRKVEVDWTFYCVLDQPGALDRKAKELGAAVMVSPAPIGQHLLFLRALRKTLRDGRYDTLHCHHDVMSAAYLLAAVGIPIRRRIVHVHNADESLPTPSRWKRGLALEPMRRLCLAADKVVGISDHTLDTFLDGRPRRPGRDVVRYYGVDPSPFEQVSADRIGFRRNLGLPEDARILLFAGRMAPIKNPLFVIDILAECRRREPRAVAVFAGTGDLEPAVRDRAAALGVAAAIRLLGWRSDVANIMMCSDCFVLPHPERPMEGFGLAVVEAQLAGLPLLLSTGIADDPLLPSASFRRLPLSLSAETWAQAALDLLCNTAPSPAAALTALQHSPMQMDQALEGLLGLHA
jgi:glycosyltransferase involved in cell wall biosynthesis